jgi:hypothetical protein
VIPVFALGFALSLVAGAVAVLLVIRSADPDARRAELQRTVGIIGIAAGTIGAIYFIARLIQLQPFA